VSVATSSHISLAKDEAELIAFRVTHDLKEIVWLFDNIAGNSGPRRHGLRYGRVEIANIKIEMDSILHRLRLGNTLETQVPDEWYVAQSDPVI
jgi:hypothetical protein